VDREEYGKRVIGLGRGFVFENLVIACTRTCAGVSRPVCTPGSSKPSTMYPTTELMYFYLS
jgi:hypothetical protein